jgi:hypothetical protein
MSYLSITIDLPPQRGEHTIPAHKRQWGRLISLASILGIGLLCNATAAATEVFTSCNPVGIRTYNDRVHVRCAESVAGIEFFAASTSDPAHTARVLSVITTAQVAGRTLDILYDPADDPSDELPGCLSHDCRILRAVGFGR